MQRHERLEQDIKVALSSIITYEVKEPEVSGMISVTDVKVTPDQKYATVYVSIYGKKNKEKVLDALKKAKGFIKNSGCISAARRAFYLGQRDQEPYLL